ncbi:MAG: hypothetical protein CL886_00595 [Dehalococcoidia bacterium]|nr:hypothetical protein [Dehalococcoidia bacterium]
MSTTEGLTLSERKLKVLDNLDKGHKALHEALSGLDPEDAFLGTRWSVWDVIKHLDSEGFVDTLESISKGASHLFPPFTSRAEKLKSDISHLDETFRRFRALIESLSEEQLVQEATPENTYNTFPALNMIELLERFSNHESNHAVQIEKTLAYIKAFNAQEKAVTIITVVTSTLPVLPDDILGMLKHADYIAATVPILNALEGKFAGLPIQLQDDNYREVVARLDRESQSGLWVVLCVSVNPSQIESDCITLATQQCEKVIQFNPNGAHYKNI